MTILGLNAYHGDSSAALVVDGQLVAAVEEERFNRVKHWAGFPAASIGYCLAAGGIKVSDLDHVAVSFDPRANLGRKALFALTRRPSLASIIDRLQRQGKTLSLRGRLAEACEVSPDLVRARFHNVEHHDAHMTQGFCLSPFDRAAILSIDGMGDFVSTVLAVGEGVQYRKLAEVFYPHSLGFLYNALTLYLGFHAYGDEYKVMGLAPYGEPVYLEEFRKIIFPQGDTFELNLDYFRHHKDGISMSWNNGAPQVEPFHSELLEKRLGPPAAPRGEPGEREQNIAASLQRVTEEIIFHLLNGLHEKTACDDVVLVGGCAMNSVAVGKVTLHSPFKRVYVPVGAADNGTAIGAAFHVWHRADGSWKLEDRSSAISPVEVGRSRVEDGRSKIEVRPQSPISQLPSPISHLPSPISHLPSSHFVLAHAFWGPAFDNAACRAAAAKFPVRVEELDDDALFDRVVDALCDGKVVGWFQGRMEFGARALGNRSLLADPRRADMRDIINLKIKFREKFRPFAPSILEEHVADYFETAAPSPFMEGPHDFDAVHWDQEPFHKPGQGTRPTICRPGALTGRFMECVFPIRPEKRALIPAVTHVDGSGRLQTVDRASNPRYYDLIACFHKRTGVPLLLNTSLNENEPIVHTPEQALDCFLRTKMDALVLENQFVERNV
jgi:carbamoyltransferase